MDVSDPFSTRGPRSNVFFFFKGSGHHRDLPSSPTRRSSDLEPDVRILRDITGRSTCEGTLADFTRYFRHRFHVLRNMVRARRELGGAQDIAKARRSTREVGRSEEHTSELQSQSNLVCRLLLE